VQNAGAVSCEGGTIGMVRIGVLPGREFSLVFHSDCRRKAEGLVRWLAHPIREVPQVWL